MTYLIIGSFLFVSLVAMIAIFKCDQLSQELTEIKAQSTVLFGDEKTSMLYQYKDEIISIPVSRLRYILDAECEKRLIVVSHSSVKVVPDFDISTQDY